MLMQFSVNNGTLGIVPVNIRTSLPKATKREKAYLSAPRNNALSGRNVASYDISLTPGPKLLTHILKSMKQDELMRSVKPFLYL